MRHHTSWSSATWTGCWRCHVRYRFVSLSSRSWGEYSLISVIVLSIFGNNGRLSMTFLLSQLKLNFRITWNNITDFTMNWCRLNFYWLPNPCESLSLEGSGSGTGSTLSSASRLGTLVGSGSYALTISSGSFSPAGRGGNNNIPCSLYPAVPRKIWNIGSVQAKSSEWLN